MRVVIQCAGSKRENGYFRANDGRTVNFVAHPELASPAARAERILARPDDIAKGSQTWRDLVLAYNRDAATTGNAWGLWRASRLYKAPVYDALVSRFGGEDVYILSAGWGLIRADFLTPRYDITFSEGVAWTRRRKRDDFADWNQLPEGNGTPVVFFGGDKYVSLFCSLTASVCAERFIFFQSAHAPEAPHCRLIRYHGARNTNWQYDCAEDFLRGKLLLNSVHLDLKSGSS